MAEYVLVTESGSDISKEVADRYGIVVVPMHVNFGGGERDDGTFPTEELYANYKHTGELPHTSGCSPQDFIDAFDRIHAERPEAHIVYLAYSAVTTVSFASAQHASEGRTYVTSIDMKSVSSGLQMVVTNVARFLEARPDSSLDEVVAFAEDQVRRIRMAFIPGDLDYLRAGGRLSNAAYLGATLLRIKPTVDIIDGRLVATKKRHGSMLKCAASLTEEFLGGEPMDTSRVNFIYSVGDGPDPILRKVVEKIASKHGFDEIEWVKTGCVIASHAGPGSFGVVACVR